MFLILENFCNSHILPISCPIFPIFWRNKILFFFSNSHIFPKGQYAIRPLCLHISNSEVLKVSKSVAHQMFQKSSHCTPCRYIGLASSHDFWFWMWYIGCRGRITEGTKNIASEANRIFLRVELLRHTWSSFISIRIQYFLANYSYKANPISSWHVDDWINLFFQTIVNRLNLIRYERLGQN
jgi:hypothetical protein